MNSKVSIIGSGKIGLTLGLLCEARGMDVMFMDSNKEYLETLKNRTHKTSEPQIEEMLQYANNVKFTNSVSDALSYADILFCVVPTPSNEDNSYNHDAIDDVVGEIVDYVNKEGGSIDGKTLVICSTTMPNYCEGISKHLSQYGMTVIYSPFFIQQGSIYNNIVNCDIVLIGCDTEVPKDLLKIYKAIVSNPNYKFLTLSGAELTKVLTNFYLSLKVAYANYSEEICLASGLTQEESEQVLEAVGSDSRIGNKFFKSGLPAGGLCLPRDVRALEKHVDDYHEHSQGIYIGDTLIEGLKSANELRMWTVTRRIREENPDLNTVIKIDQLSYKKGVPIITESRHLELAESLLKEGYNLHITESEATIELAKPILEKYNSQIKYTIR